MKINRIIIIPSSIIFCMLFSSCSSITLIRIQELKQVEAHVDSLKAMVDSEQQALRNEEKSQNELLRLIRADMQVRFEELGQKIGALAQRSETEPRDVFDLDLLLSTYPDAIKSGDVDYLKKPDATPEAGSCFTCVCRPKNDLVLDA